MGEQVAEAALRARGFDILARNARMNGVEFDIVARHGDEAWFVEVKTRSGTAAGFPYEQIRGDKLDRMENGALEFLERHSIPDLDCRLVAASIVVADGDSEPILEWIPLL